MVPGAHMQIYVTVFSSHILSIYLSVLCAFPECVQMHNVCSWESCFIVKRVPFGKKGEGRWGVLGHDIQIWAISEDPTCHASTLHRLNLKTCSQKYLH